MQNTVERILEETRKTISTQCIGDNHVADKRTDPTNLGICILSKDRECFEAGDFENVFPLQNLLKVFILTIALEELGPETVFSIVGTENKEEGFDVQTKAKKGQYLSPNPLSDTGALVLASYLALRLPMEDMIAKIKSLCMDDSLAINKNAQLSEMMNIHRNRSMACYLENNGFRHEESDKCLRFYFTLCALNVTVKDLATFALILANQGIDTESESRVVKKENAMIVKSCMLISGMYNESGEFALNVGLPSKCGTAGGIMSVVNGQMGIGVYGPLLNANGISLGGKKMLEHLSKELEFNMFL